MSQMTSTQTVVVLACHPDTAPSMRRYGELLEDAYRCAGWRVTVLRPPRSLSHLVPANTRARKLLNYLEKLALFPVTLPWRIPRGALVHVADHSDAPWVHFVPTGTPVLITCHDLIAIRAARGLLPEHRPRWSGRLYQRWIAVSLQRATLIAAVSATTLKDVREILPDVPTSLLRNPIAPALAHARTPVRPEIVGPYLLLVSTAGWRKRRHLSIRAWQQLRERSCRQIELVVVGDALQSGELALAGLHEIPEHMKRFEHVSDDELAGFYKYADGLLMMSSQEGFGWPVVEANWWGTVAVCADLPVFHEVGPGNVFIGDELDGVDWAAVRDSVADTERRSRVRADAHQFSPDRFRTELNMLACRLLGPRVD